MEETSQKSGPFTGTTADLETYVMGDDERSLKEERKRQFVELRAKGCSYAKIADELGVSKGTLARWNAELESDIARLKAIEAPITGKPAGNDCKIQNE